MHATFLLTALILGQCAGGSCPAPSVFRGGMYAQPQYIPQYQPQVVRQQIPAYSMPEPNAPFEPTPEKDWYPITHKGLNFKVWGYKTSDGRVTWEPSQPFNKTSFNAAVAASVKAKQEAAELAKAEQPRPPEPVKPVEQPKPVANNFGLEASKVGKNIGYTGSVREYEMQAGKTSASKLYLTVIGTPADRKQVVEDWKSHPEYNDLRGSVNFGEYNRGDWQVADNLGYAGNGKPTILIQQPSGRVDYRAYDYAGGAKGIAQALRRADPTYRPERDPGPSNVIPGLDTYTQAAVGVAVVTLLALVVLPRRKP